MHPYIIFITNNNLQLFKLIINRKEIAELVNEKKQAGSCLCLRPLAKTGMQSI